MSVGPDGMTWDYHVIEKANIENPEIKKYQLAGHCNFADIDVSQYEKMAVEAERESDENMGALGPPWYPSCDCLFAIYQQGS